MVARNTPLKDLRVAWSRGCSFAIYRKKALFSGRGHFNASCLQALTRMAVDEHVFLEADLPSQCLLFSRYTMLRAARCKDQPVFHNMVFLPRKTRTRNQWHVWFWNLDVLYFCDIFPSSNGQFKINLVSPPTRPVKRPPCRWAPFSGVYLVFHCIPSVLLIPPADDAFDTPLLMTPISSCIHILHQKPGLVVDTPLCRWHISAIFDPPCWWRVCLVNNKEVPFIGPSFPSLFLCSHSGRRVNGKISPLGAVLFLIIAVHGSGLSNLICARPCAFVVEVGWWPERSLNSAIQGIGFEKGCILIPSPGHRPSFRRGNPSCLMTGLA